jgi:hypothetical protein
MLPKLIRGTCAANAETVHATAVAIGGAGVLLCGPSGSGKSDLALRLIDRGAILVADDVVNLRLADGHLHAYPEPALRGLLEVRGVGIIEFPYLDEAPVALAVRLDGEGGDVVLRDVRLPTISMDAFALHTPLLVELQLSPLVGGAA